MDQSGNRSIILFKVTRKKKRGGGKTNAEDSSQLQQLGYLRLTKMLQGKKKEEQKEIKIINETWQGGGNRPTNVVG